MKKQQLVAAIAALSALCITGCNNEMMEDGAPQAGKQVMMTLQGMTDAPQTRADYTEEIDTKNMNFSWRSGDALSVVVDNETANKNCQLTTTTEGKSAPFSGTVTTFAGTKTIYAFYPYNNTTPYVVTGGNNTETATATLTLPNPQLYTIGGAISNSFMVGVGSATANADAITASASLKQVMSIIKLNITNATNKVVTGVKLKSLYVLPIQATVNLSTAEVTNSGGMRNGLSMTVTDDNSAAANKSISFAIFPADLSGKEIEIEVTFKDGTTKSIKKTGINFERNVHYTMEFDGTPLPNYIEVNGIKVAIGNLVADGANGAKIGTATDRGLYFQFGSLVGWNAEGYYPKVVVSPVDCTVTSWNNSWTGDPNTDDAVLGKGDPCRYYLKGTWRLPTTDEYKALFKNQTKFSSTSSPWKWENSSATNATLGLTFPASGYREGSDGNISIVGTYGYYWSASLSSASNGYSLYFSSSYVSPSSLSNRPFGLPVRCVQASN